MTEKMKLDIISDVVCPWCIIGYGYLTQAIKELGIEDQVEVEWHPFELNPDMPADGEELRAHSARKYGSTPESSKQFRQEMSKRGKKVGFDFDYFDGMKIVNTRRAHILLELAKEVDKQTEFKFRLFTAFFNEHKDVSHIDVLLKEAEVVGLDIAQAKQRLVSTKAYKDIEQQEMSWHRMGISSVPTVVFNRRSALSGAHPVETYKQVLSQEVSKKLD